MANLPIASQPRDVRYCGCWRESQAWAGDTQITHQSKRGGPSVLLIPTPQSAVEAHARLSAALDEIYESIQALIEVAANRDVDTPIRTYTVLWLAKKAEAGFGDSFDYLARLNPADNAEEDSGDGDQPYTAAA
jgi:hypothetical protein